MRRGSESLARTRRFTTPLGTVSVHHVDPAFFFGFEDAGRGGRLATPEKALVDFLYLGPARSRLVRALPELELPGRFSVRVARAIVARALERIVGAGRARPRERSHSQRRDTTGRAARRASM